MLIKCPECGKDVSDKAPACIHCGFPLNDIHKENTCLVDGAEYDMTELKNYYAKLTDYEKGEFYRRIKVCMRVILKSSQMKQQRF